MANDPDDSFPIQFRMRADTVADIDALATELHWTRSDVIRFILTKGYRPDKEDRKLSIDASTLDSLLGEHPLKQGKEFDDDFWY